MIDGWADPRWSEERWSESNQGQTHALSARGGFVLQAVASRLGAQHLLSARGGFRVDAYGIGRGAPWAIHPLTARTMPGRVGVNAAATYLRFQHKLSAKPRIGLFATAGPLRYAHRLAAEGRFALTVAGRLAWRHRLAARGAVGLFAAATDLDLSHPLSAKGRIGLFAWGTYTVVIPNPNRIIEIGTVPGTVNLLRNPSAEVSLVGWLPVGGAALSVSTTRAWVGGASVLLVGGAAGDGATVQTEPWQPPALRSGDVLWGSMAAYAPTGATLSIAARAHQGGSVLVGAAQTWAVPAGAWVVVASYPVEPNPALQLDAASLLVTVASAGQVWLDGAQIELDRWSIGPTAYVGPVAA